MVFVRGRAVGVGSALGVGADLSDFLFAFAGDGPDEFFGEIGEHDRFLPYPLGAGTEGWGALIEQAFSNVIPAGGMVRL
jgi:hypothetical protein